MTRTTNPNAQTHQNGKSNHPHTGYSLKTKTYHTPIETEVTHDEANQRMLEGILTADSCILVKRAFGQRAAVARTWVAAN